MSLSPAVITLLFLAFAIVMFVTEKIPLGLTSMIVCVGLCLTGVLDVKTAFSGFIDSNVILFVAMFIVGGADAFAAVPEAAGCLLPGGEEADDAERHLDQLQRRLQQHESELLFLHAGIRQGEI